MDGCSLACATARPSRNLVPVGPRYRCSIGAPTRALANLAQHDSCCAVASCCAPSAVAVAAIVHASVCCTAWGTPPGHTALLASIAIAAVRGGSCPAACHASRHASIVPHFVAELHAPLENGASKFNNASRVISSMSIPVPPLPASSAATSASCATLSLVSILFCCACEVCLTKRVARTKNRVPGVARYY